EVGAARLPPVVVPVGLQPAAVVRLQRRQPQLGAAGAEPGGGARAPRASGTPPAPRHDAPSCTPAPTPGPVSASPQVRAVQTRERGAYGGEPAAAPTLPARGCGPWRSMVCWPNECPPDR